MYPHTVNGPLDFSHIFQTYGSASSDATSLAVFNTFAVHTENEGGVGIGLGVAYNSLKGLGSVLTYSGDATSCTFSFSLDVHLERESKHEPKPEVIASHSMSIAESSQSRPTKILLVDDSAICLRITNRLVQGLGFETETVESGTM